MICDPIVDEVRAIREQLAAQFGFDIRQIVADAQQRQASSGARIVSFQKPSHPLQPIRTAIAASPGSESGKTAPAAERHGGTL